jgi:hypothetical protein
VKERIAEYEFKNGSEKAIHKDGVKEELDGTAAGEIHFQHHD